MPTAATASSGAATFARAGLGGSAVEVCSRRRRSCCGVGACPDQHRAELLRLNESTVEQIVDRLQRVDQLNTLTARLPSTAQLLPQSVDVVERD